MYVQWGKRGSNRPALRYTAKPVWELPKGRLQTVYSREFSITPASFHLFLSANSKFDS